MTYRERRERKAERYREWAEGRREKADALHKANEPFRGDVAFNTQPGHIPERARAIRRTEKATEHTLKAFSHDRKAEGIESQLESSIYSDDPDAVEALEARVATLEAERDRVKRYNATARKGSPDLSILDEKQKEQLLSCIQVWGDIQCKNGAFPSYHLQNLGGNINRNKKRLAQLKAS